VTGTTSQWRSLWRCPAAQPVLHRAVRYCQRFAVHVGKCYFCSGHNKSAARLITSTSQRYVHIACLITSTTQRYVQIACTAGHPSGKANVGQLTCLCKISLWVRRFYWNWTSQNGYFFRHSLCQTSCRLVEECRKKRPKFYRLFKVKCGFHPHRFSRNSQISRRSMLIFAFPNLNKTGHCVWTTARINSFTHRSVNFTKPIFMKLVSCRRRRWRTATIIFMKILLRV
jgi:hypothetical protein